MSVRPRLFCLFSLFGRSSRTNWCKKNKKKRQLKKIYYPFIVVSIGWTVVVILNCIDLDTLNQFNHQKLVWIIIIMDFWLLFYFSFSNSDDSPSINAFALPFSYDRRTVIKFISILLPLILFFFLFVQFKIVQKPSSLTKKKTGQLHTSGFNNYYFIIRNL